MSLVPYIHKAVNREHLSAAEAQSLMELVLAGSVSTAQLASFLVALRMKGETADELLGFARAMRAESLRVDTGLNGEPIVDTCGTGGDGACTFNVSTVAAIVVAAAGVRVAKHGNRSISSQCGSADILEGLGVAITMPPERIAQCIREVGIGFLFAPSIHPAMKHAQAARVELKMRTAFNLLGPLTNPAGASAQVVGAPSLRAAELIAQALAALGLRRGFVVHGMDGLDEITTTGPTIVYEIRRGAIADSTVTPEDFGLPVASMADLQGADRETNCAIARSILAGNKGAPRDIVIANSSAALVAAGAAADFLEGAHKAADAIDSGDASKKLTEFVSFTQDLTRV